MSEHPKIERVEVYRDSAGEWRFTAYATNGKAIARESEGYTHRDDAWGAASGSWPDAEIKEREVESPIPGQTDLEGGEVPPPNEGGT
jgi:uncharacterized protein YegP (UPF0339 family)